MPQKVETDPDDPSAIGSRAAVALRRWFDLDPIGGRAAIIDEISQPKPRFSLRELGILPDKTLPNVDRLLVEHLGEAEEFEVRVKLVQLIARYGTPKILPQVLQKLDANIEKWGCVLQTPLLAYVLRVDPEAARPRLEKAIATRDRTNMCDDRFFGEIAKIHYDPLLEELRCSLIEIESEHRRGCDGVAVKLRFLCGGTTVVATV